jgi:hypothetical protein
MLLIVSSISAQTINSSNSTVGFYFEAGYNFFKLEGVEENYKYVIEQYNSRNIPVKTQKLFPWNGIFGGGMYFKMPDDINLLLGVNYTSSQAYSLYGDYSGELDIKGDVTSYLLYLGLQKIINEQASLSPIAEVGIAYGLSEFVLSSKIKLINGSADEDNVKFESRNLYALPSIGLRYKLKSIGFYLKTGVKLLVIKNQSNDWNALEIDISGLFISSGVSFTLN